LYGTTLGASFSCITPHRRAHFLNKYVNETDPVLKRAWAGRMPFT
jgi:hypothetical protein